MTADTVLGRRMVPCLTLLTLGSVISVEASAQQCTGARNDKVVTMSGQIIVSPELAIGDLIHLATGPAENKVSYYCDTTGRIARDYKFSRLPYPVQVPSLSKTYPTNVPGVGVRVQFKSGGNPGSSWTYPSLENVTAKGGIIVHMSSHGASYRFVKTGPVSPGVISAGDLPEVKLDIYYPGSAGAPVNTFLTGRASGQLTILIPTCTLQAGQSNFTVQLDAVPGKELAGSAVQKPKDFTLDLINCQNAARVRYTFDGLTDATDGVYFRNTGTARGVAVSLQSVSGGTTAQIPANGTTGASGTRVRHVTVAGGRASLTIRAGYKGVGGAAQLKPGTVQSQITVTMLYL